MSIVSSFKPRSGRGFSLVELLVVVAIIGILAVMLLPNLIAALDKGKQKTTMSDMRQIGAAMMSWYTDAMGAAAAGQAQLPTVDYGAIRAVSYEDLLKILVLGGMDPSRQLPMYIQTIPQVDGWGTGYQFAIAENLDDPMVLAIRSAGSNRVSGTTSMFEGPVYESGAYLSFRTECDIVWVDGRLVFFPESKRIVDAQSVEAGAGTCL